MDNFKEELQRIRNESERRMGAIMEESKKIGERIKNEFKDFENEINFARKISREAVTRIILLSAGIIGFSVSLFSIPGIGTNLKLNFVRFSWYALVGVIVLGFLILFLEGRIEQAVIWKSFQLKQYPENNKYKFWQKFSAILIFLVTILYPKNLLFNRPYKQGSEKIFKETTNSLLVHYLARSRGIIDIFENIIILLFITALILLILSFPIEFL